MILNEERSEEDIIIDALRNSHFIFGKSKFGYFTEDNVGEFLKTEAFELVEETANYDIWQRFGIKIYVVNDHNEFNFATRKLEEMGLPLNSEHYDVYASDYWPS